MVKNQEILIRDCNFSNAIHLENLVELINEYISDEMGGGTPIENNQKLYLVDGLNNHPAKIIRFAIIGQEIVGLIVCFETFATFSVKKCINIHDIIVRKKFRERGIGRALMNNIIDEAKQRDYAKVTLEVREDNYKAQMLYNSLGFEDCQPPMKFWVKKL